MKTLKIQFTTITVLAALFTLNLNATTNTPNLSEEMYIGDIPFNTETVADNYTMSEISSEFDFSEEYEIFDIPFNTACITVDCRYELAIAEEFEMEDEIYINDIPFNTEKISSVANQAEFEEEAYIDDIPFDTYSVVSQLDCPEYAMK